MSGKLRDLPEKEKNAILALIDYKTESDMKEVLNKLDAIESKFEAKFSLLLWVVGALGFMITIMITIFKFIG